MKKRRVTKPVYVGDVKVGGDAEIAVQSMTKTDTRDVKATVRQIHELEEVGCDIIRAAVPDMEAAQAMAEIKKQINIPLIADIHFHYQLAIECAKGGVDCLRLNPGNLRNEGAGQGSGAGGQGAGHSHPHRGELRQPAPGGRHRTHAGLFPPHGFGEQAAQGRRGRGRESTASWTTWWRRRCGKSALLEQQDFDQIKISLKAFDVPTTVEAYRQNWRTWCPYPFHLGITEAGTAQSGSIRTAVGLGYLLYEGIGDTIRVSLSDDSREEVYVGYEILKSLNLRSKGTTLVACPSCGRADVDVRKLANDVDALLKKTDKNIKVAVMGCEVNGPGEAKDADVGIAAGAGRAVIFRKGQKVRVVPEEEMFTALMEEVENTPVEIGD